MSNKYEVEATKYAFTIRKNWDIISYNNRFANFNLSEWEILNFIESYEWEDLMKDLLAFNELKYENDFLDLSNDLEDVLIWREWIDKKLFFLWWLNKKLQENWKWRTILVWWSAVEFWTNSNVKSFDIDIVYHTNEDIWEILQDYWFNREWRYFSNSELWIHLECPWTILDWKRDPDSILLSWKDTNALVISIEDLIIDRLQQLSQWNKECEWHIIMMLLTKVREIDFVFLKERIKEEWLEKVFDFSNFIN